MAGNRSPAPAYWDLMQFDPSLMSLFPMLGTIAFHYRIIPETDVSDATAPAITIYSSAICPYCVMAKNFLKSKGLDWTEIRIDLDLAERQRMMDLAKRTSVPQIFVGDVHVGGYDDMIALHRAGKFEALFTPEGAAGEGA